ncbi:hypothetical protein CI109_101011 [Kwoniella shandongensis]|uniref:Uncharacterized protein n=1 Tax=Kwoniella shandongensis TaxID=1734106 RepID=A0A5M6C4N0_9TREE|nr:uncharacterized protein CI109_001480 [Kwoniella shandongensis]KAA5530076.1 hypothetical protein CI109_001480 [Kwoniella shandongensis]
MRPCIPRVPLRQTPISLRLGVRANHSAPPPPPKTPVEPTVFADKSSPREVHNRPEIIRGMPPLGSKPKVTTSTGEKGFSTKGREEAFSGPSKPRLVYSRPGERDLPKLKSRAPLVIGLSLLGLGWGLFLLHATNSERLASSVLRQVTFQLRNSPQVIGILGENVRLQENWWALGQPWINGTINLMQGRVDLSFRIRGNKGGGTVYFTSIRPQEQGAWRIVRYKLIADDGEVIMLENMQARS